MKTGWILEVESIELVDVEGRGGNPLMYTEGYYLLGGVCEGGGERWRKGGWSSVGRPPRIMKIANIY